MKTRIKQGFTLIELLVVITIIAILASLSMGAIGKMQEKGQITKAINNCRQIILSIKLYASDEGGRYPDQASGAEASTSNDAFRQLFIAGATQDEKFFGCGASPFIPDGNIGTAPEYTDAVKAGENHWAMMKGLSDSSPGGIPLVFENPASSGADPSWNADLAGQSKKGRTWSGGKVVVGTNDGSVEVQKCAAAAGTVTLKAAGDGGKNLFTQFASEDGSSSFEMLDVDGGEK